MRFVFNSNVYLSALLYGGNPRLIVEATFLEGHHVFISEEIYTEMRRVITKKFPKFKAEYLAFESFIKLQTILVPVGVLNINVCRDPKDNIILETAEISRAEFIVTGDNDLLVLQIYNKIQIVSPKEAINRLLE